MSDQEPKSEEKGMARELISNSASIPDLAPPFAWIVQKLVALDLRRKHPETGSIFLSWLSASSAESVRLAVLSAIFETSRPMEISILRQRMGFSGTVSTQKHIAEMHNLRVERIRQIEKGSFRAIHRRILDGLPKPSPKIENADDGLRQPIEQLTIERLPALLMPIDSLELSVRMYNCLRNAKIDNLGDLVRMTDVQLRKIKLFGRKSIKEIRDILASMSLGLGMTFSEELANAYREANRPNSH